MNDQRQTLARQLRVISRVAVLVMVPIVFYFTSRGTWDPRQQINDGGWSAGFFMAQADSMLHARLDVQERDIHAECFWRETRCYGYFGITPSVLRIPVLGILRWFRSAFTPLYITVAILVAYWAALRLLQRSLCASADPDPPRYLVLGYAILGAAALGPASTLLFVTRPAVFEEAIAWSIAFVLLALNHVWAWQAREHNSLIPAVLFGSAAANARPTAALACGVLGLLVAALWYRRDPRAERRVLTAALCLSLLPGLTAGAVFWLKLRTPVPSPLLNEQLQQAPHWRDILRNNGHKTMSLMFTPTELVAYFRPDAVTRQSGWPFFDFRFPREPILWVPPLPENGAYTERFTSLTATMPLPWIVNVIVLGWLTRTGWVVVVRGRGQSTSARAPALSGDQLLLAAGFFASAGAMIVLVITTAGITNRYLSDFYATSVVGFAIGHHAIVPFFGRRPVAAAFAGLAGVLLVCWSVVVTLSLTTRLVFD
jgi:hypothetical protein